MAKFRVPWPADTAERHAFFERAARTLVKHGTYEGTPDAGAFQGNTPVGPFAGIYYSPEGADFLEIELIKKPWIVPIAVVEDQVRKYLAKV